MIEQLGPMVKNLLLRFYAKSPLKLKPERIVFFRDGVSEGQFQHCLTRELPQIKQACRVGPGRIKVLKSLGGWHLTQEAKVYIVLQNCGRTF